MAVWRPFLVWAIATGVLLGLFWLFAYGTGWPPALDSCVKDMSCYCEWFDLDKLRAAEASGTWWKGVQQPVNTYSNLYAVISAGYVACRMWRDRKAGTNSSVIMSNWWMGDVWVFCVLFLGLGSMWFHGSISQWVSWFDGFSMYVFTGFMVFYTLDRGFVRHGVSKKIRTWTFLTGYPVSVVLFTIVGAVGVPSEILIGTMIGAYIAIELFYARFVFAPQWSWAAFKRAPFLMWLGGLIAFGMAALFRALSTKPDDPWCTPESFWQPHGLLWHTYAGVMALCIYFYWREDAGGIGSLQAGATGGSGGSGSAGGGTSSASGTVWT